MADLPTVPAFNHNGSWNESTRKHPALNVMETITTEFERTNKLNPNWFTADVTFQNENGSEFHGVDNVLAAVRQYYSPFTSLYHEPQSFMCTDTDDGFKIKGQAKLFGNLPGPAADGEIRVKDKTGKEWDIAIPGGWINEYVKYENELGWAIKRSEVPGDGGIVKDVLLKRGQISAKDLGL